MRKWRCLLLGAIALLAPPELRAQPHSPDDGRPPLEWPSRTIRPEVRAISADLQASAELARVALPIAALLGRQWWLPTGVVILGVLGAYALHRARVARLLELERVRMRIATDLHDDIGASLTQIAILTEVAQRRMTVLDPAVVEPIARVSSISRELVDSMSEIVWAINPRHDRLSDLAAHMRRFASDVLICRHIALAFHAPDDVLNVPMGTDHRRQCFLAFKEAIHNTVRHAECTEVVVGIARAGRSLVISVRDNGAGFDPRQASQGHGIRSMQARARTIGGRLEIVSRPNGGTTVRFIMPLHHRGFRDVRLPRSLRPATITTPVSVEGPWRRLSGYPECPPAVGGERPHRRGCHMRQGLRQLRFGLTLLAMSPAAMGGCALQKEARLPLSPEQRGEALFTKETFGGNGRVCGTCHELNQFGTITPVFVQQLFKKDPSAPLFRKIDSDDGRGTSYKRLMEHATMRIPIELPTRTASGLGIRKCDDPANTSFVAHRGNPSVFNMALELHLMHDGREGNDLAAQALNAVRTHNEPGRQPRAEELAAIADFQKSLFSHEAVRAFLSKGTEPKLPDGSTLPEKRGRAFFEPDRQCGVCHSGPMLNRTSRFHDVVVGAAFESSGVGIEPGNPNEKFKWCWVDLATNAIVPGPSGSREVFKNPVSDPGRVVVAGVTEFRSTNGALLFVPNETLADVAGPLFKIPTLWGTPDTAPYFHDNSAKDLDAVLDQYNFLFRLLPEFAAHVKCDPKAAECLSEDDKADIISFMQLLSFEKVATR